MRTQPDLNPPSSLAHAAAEFAAIRPVTASAPLHWLRKAWDDLRASPAASLFYGLTFALMGWGIVFFYGNAYSLTAALMGGFMLLGPALAMGLYDLSRQREAGAPPRLRPSLIAWRQNLSNLALYALVTGVVFLIWSRASLVIFAVFYTSGLPTAADFFRELLAFDNIGFALTYLLVGAGFASFIFAISVLAVPLMLDRDKDAITAMLLSLAAIARNPLPLLIWAVLLVSLIGVGFATGFLGLIITAPLAGHASWHAYRAMMPSA